MLTLLLPSNGDIRVKWLGLRVVWLVYYEWYAMGGYLTMAVRNNWINFFIRFFDIHVPRSGRKPKTKKEQIEHVMEKVKEKGYRPVLF